MRVLRLEKLGIGFLLVGYFGEVFGCLVPRGVGSVGIRLVLSFAFVVFWRRPGALLLLLLFGGGIGRG